MTNTELLRKKIDQSGYKLTFIARECGLTYQGFMNKVNNESGFFASEIMILQKLLRLTQAEVMAIFFATEVD